MSFWDKLFAEKKYVLGLSPMDGVTDVPFRYMVGKYGRIHGEETPPAFGVPTWPLATSPVEESPHRGLDVMFTEFVSVDALAHVTDKRKAEMVLRALLRARDVGNSDWVPPLQKSAREQPFSEPTRTDPVGWPYEVAQVFGHTPELFYKAAVLVATLGFDGLDINMGCPAHKVEELGSGAGLIRTPETALEIVRQAKLGIRDWAAGKVKIEDLGYSEAVREWVGEHTRVSPLQKSARERPLIPVSLKTRIGVSSNQVEEWIPKIMESEPAVLSLHGRTLKQLYQGQADWEAIARAAEIVHSMGGKILGNGDVKRVISDQGAASRNTETIGSAEEVVDRYGVDGVLIGRAAEGNPCVFVGIEPDKEQRLAWIAEHAEVYNRLFVERESEEFRERAFVPLRKHLAWYASGFPGASELRQKLVLTKDMDAVRSVVAVTTSDKID
jgi:tRNA-dihydrouridine synthase B